MDLASEGKRPVGLNLWPDGWCHQKEECVEDLKLQSLLEVLHATGMNLSHFSFLLAVLVTTSINNYNLSINTVAHFHLCAAHNFPPNSIYCFLSADGELFSMIWTGYQQKQVPAHSNNNLMGSFVRHCPSLLLIHPPRTGTVVGIANVSWGSGPHLACWFYRAGVSFGAIFGAQVSRLVKPPPTICNC